MATLSAVGSLLFGWFSVVTIIGFAALAVAIFLPKPLDWITDLRKWSIVVAVCAFSIAGLSAHYFALGIKVTRAEWDAARNNAEAAKLVQEQFIAAQAAAQERAQIADERAADAKAIEDLNSYVATLEKSRSNGVCALTDADVEWLRKQ